MIMNKQQQQRKKNSIIFNVSERYNKIVSVCFQMIYHFDVFIAIFPQFECNREGGWADER